MPMAICCRSLSKQTSILRVRLKERAGEGKVSGQVEADDELGVKDCGKVLNVTEFERI